MLRIYLVTMIALIPSCQTAHASKEKVLEEVVVTGRKLPGPGIDLKATRTVYDREAIESLQAGSVFDVLENIPGVDLAGGPRANGININIRGFTDNEDVLFIVDGAVKNFEKYRFGSIPLEPELLSELSVSRGPASVIQGSGAIGGTVELKTRNPDEMLINEQTSGGFLKYGHATNNDENLAIVSVYAQLDNGFGALFSNTKRNSNNIELSSGEKLPWSASKPESSLGKINYQGDIITATLAYSRIQSEGREFFDTSTFANSVNGAVYRVMDDRTYSFLTEFNPATALINTNLSLAYTKSGVFENALDGNNNLTARSWDYDYDIWSVRLNNESLIQLTDSQFFIIQAGWQGNREERTTAIIDTAGNQSQASLSQPSGATNSLGSYLQAEWQWHDLSATAGYRWDINRVEVRNPEIIALLETVGQASTIDQRNGLLNYRLAYTFESVPVEIFHSYTEAARYPKLDEYFTVGTFSRCSNTITQADVIYNQLIEKKSNNALTIASIEDSSVAAIGSFSARIEDERLYKIKAQRIALQTYIDSVKSNTMLSADEKDETISAARNITENYINNTLTNSAINAINAFTVEKQQQTLLSIDAIEQSFTDELLGYGIDPSSNLDSLDYPTRTILPQPQQDNQFCGALYQPETANNREWGFRYRHSNFINPHDSLIVKLVHFRTEVRNTLESLNTNPAMPVSQPGRESISGYELEASYQVDSWRFDLTYNRLRGKKSGYVLTDNADAVNVLDREIYQYQDTEKFDLPADEITFSSSWISSDSQWEWGVRLSYKASRNALAFSDDFNYGISRQPPIRTADLFANWKPSTHTVIRLNIDNLTNTRYRLPSGYDPASGQYILGNENPARNLKLSLTQYF